MADHPLTAGDFRPKFGFNLAISHGPVSSGCNQYLDIRPGDTGPGQTLQNVRENVTHRGRACVVVTQDEYTLSGPHHILQGTCAQGVVQCRGNGDVGIRRRRNRRRTHDLAQIGFVQGKGQNTIMRYREG